MYLDIGRRLRQLHEHRAEFDQTVNGTQKLDSVDFVVAAGGARLSSTQRSKQSVRSGAMAGRDGGVFAG